MVVGALVDVLVGGFGGVVGVFVGFFVTGFRVGVAAVVIGVKEASAGDVTSSVVCSVMIDGIAGLSVAQKKKLLIISETIFISCIVIPVALIGALVVTFECTAPTVVTSTII